MPWTFGHSLPARAIESGQPVTICLLAPSLVPNQRARSALVAGTLLARSVIEPSLAQILAVGELEERVAIVQERLPGYPLSRWRLERMEKGPVPLAACSRIISAVVTAHRAVHRVLPYQGTLHPDAIRLGPGQVRLADWHLGPSLDPRLWGAALTRAGADSLLAPEIGWGVPLTSSADTYGIAALTAWLLSGTYSNQGPLTDQPLRSDLPTDLVALLFNALDENPSYRRATSEGIAAALARAAEAAGD